jgi:methionine-rich copper-binding protein CopC
MHLPGKIAALALLAFLVPVTQAGAMRALETSPAARSIMDGNRQEFILRFQGPVDHAGSSLSVLQDDRVVRKLQPRLGASPNTLFAIAGGLAPGAYTLRWVAKSHRSGTMIEGGLDFTVR